MCLRRRPSWGLRFGSLVDNPHGGSFGEGGILRLCRKVQLARNRSVGESKKKNIHKKAGPVKVNKTVSLIINFDIHKGQNQNVKKITHFRAFFTAFRRVVHFPGGVFQQGSYLGSDIFRFLLKISRGWSIFGVGSHPLDRCLGQSQLQTFSVLCTVSR